jgi:methyl-accepting chemotaxis protein
MKFHLSKVLSIRNRILLSTTGLLLIFLVATLLVTQRQLEKALARGDYLAPHFSRFLGAQEYVGGFLEVMVGTMASDDRLGRCLAEAHAAPSSAGAADPTKAVAASAPCSVADRWGELMAKLDATVAPELALVADAGDVPAAGTGTGLSAETLRRSFFYQQVSQGLASSAWVEFDGAGYLAAGAPVKNGDGSRVGTVLVGLSLDSLFSSHAAHSDAAREKQQNVFFIVDDRCLGSSFTTKEAAPDDLVAAFRSENRQKVSEGDTTLEVIVLGDRQYDFHTRPHPVIAGAAARDGHLVVARQRTHFAERQTELARAIYWTGGIAVLVGLLLSFVVAWTIVRPLRGFIQYTEQMARGGGDLTHRFPAKGFDELGVLARNLNGILDHLQELFKQVKDSSLEVGNSASEISVTAGQLHERAQEQYSKITEISGSVHEMNTSIHQLARHASQAADHAQRGSEAVTGASDAISNMKTVVVDASEHVKTLGEHSVRIGNIVETIRQIADQTSLLALNASIEAAHAGDQGKGFAVVANEVSNLADRVTKSARQIEDQLAQISRLTEQAVRKMEDGKTTVDSSVQKVGSTFSELQTMMSLVQGIGEHEKEQAAASDGIAKAMQDMYEIVKEGLHATEQTVHEGERLKDLGTLLLESVGQFKIADEPAVPAVRALPARREEDRRSRSGEP